MLSPHVLHPLIGGLFILELTSLVVFAHQGMTNLLLYRASRRPELRVYALWCLWMALFTCCFLSFQVEVGVTLRMLALHGMTIFGTLAMRAYMLSLGRFLGERDPWFYRVANAQLVVMVWPIASAASYLSGGPPFFLHEPLQAPVSIALRIVGESAPRHEVYPAHAAVLLTFLVVDFGLLLRAARRAPERDPWVTAGILITCGAVAFELMEAKLQFRHAIPVLYAANLVEVLRITYASTMRVGHDNATLEHALEEQRRALDLQVAALRDASHWAQLGEITAHLGHDMRTPIGSASLFVRAARRRMEGDESAVALLDKAEQALGQLTHLVTGIGRYSRVRHGADPGPVCLRRVARDVEILCAARISDASAELRVDVPEDLMLSGGHSELMQVFMNLLANACDAIAGSPERWIRLEAVAEHGNAVVRVSDAGARPRPDVAQRMFAPFFTTKSTEAGTGLGLSISQRIVTSLGGTLTLDPSSPTTALVVTLPLADRSRAAAAVA